MYIHNLGEDHVSKYIMRRATCSLQIQPSLPAPSRSEETGDGCICKLKLSVIELGSNSGSKVELN